MGDIDTLQNSGNRRCRIQASPQENQEQRGSDGNRS